MTTTHVQQARSAIEAAAPRLVHMPDEDAANGALGITVTYLWTPEGTDIAEYYCHPDGSFACGNIGVSGSMQYPFTDLSAFVIGLALVGGHR